MSERAYNTVKAGELLGGLHPRDVCTLIKRGKLRAKRQVVRGVGRKPRYLILESAIDSYLEHLEDANASSTAPPARAPKKPRRGNLSDVIEFV